MIALRLQLSCLHRLLELRGERWVPHTMLKLGNEDEDGLLVHNFHDPVHPDRVVPHVVVSDHDVVANFHRNLGVPCARQRFIRANVGWPLWPTLRVGHNRGRPLVTITPALLPEGRGLTSGKIQSQRDSLHLVLHSGGSQFYRVRRPNPRPARE